MEEILKSLELLESSSESVPALVWSGSEKVITDTFLPKFDAGIDRPCETADFEEFLSFAEGNIRALRTLLLKISSFFVQEGVSTKKVNAKKSFTVSLLVLCGEHSAIAPWSSEETVNLSKEILDLFCGLYGLNVCNLLVGGGEVEAMFKPALLALRPKLLKNTWKHYPAAVASYQWLLLQVRMPNLSDHLDTILPTALIVVDDYIHENKICGMICLQHIIEHVTRTELCWYGQAEVIYKSLEPILYLRDPEVLESALGCMTSIVAKIEYDLKENTEILRWTRFDSFLQTVLVSMEQEQQTGLRLAYIKKLAPLLQLSGIGLARWSKRLLRVLQEYLETAPYCKEPTTAYTLEALQVYLKICSPRIPHHFPNLMQMLLRILYDMTQDTSTVCEQAVLDLIEDCLKLVVQHAPDKTQILCQDIKSKTRFNTKFSQVMDNVFA